MIAWLVAAAMVRPELTVARIFGGEFSDQDELAGSPWLDGKHLAVRTRDGLDELDVASGAKTPLVTGADLTPKGSSAPLRPQGVSMDAGHKHLLIYTNAKKVWRQYTRGDYWLLDLTTKKLTQVGVDASSRPEPRSLMFAKLSPDGHQVGYVQANNLYVQDTGTSRVTQLTRDGSETTVNGTFDWVYEEELDLRDGWSWSPDGTHIAYWQLDTKPEPVYTLLNYTDSRYPTPLRFPYPKTGENNANARIGVVPASGGATVWTDVIADSKSGYLSRMQWADNSKELLIQKQNRLQNQTDFRLADAASGASRSVFLDTDPAYVEILANDTGDHSARWINNGREFLVLSEKDGWRHLYAVSRDAKTRLLTPGAMDVMGIAGADAKNVYFYASPKSAIQKYLFRVGLNDTQVAQVTPVGYTGTNDYNVSPDGTLAIHAHHRFDTPPDRELVRLPGHARVRDLGDNAALKQKLKAEGLGETRFMQLQTADGQEMDASLILPPRFDPNHRYPVLFHVYGEPWGTTVNDSWGGEEYLFHQMLAQRGYIVASIDNRGTPAPKGRAWRKSIYKKIGVIASDDQAAGAQQLAKLSYVDGSRIGVWGWSGGGSMTLNLMFRHPEIYRLGMSVAPVPDVNLYDTIYQERYMGLPSENPKEYEQSSPITFAANLKGALLIVHGSGDDNVHFQGTERLINRLVELGKPFQMMMYPNRTHAISEGPGTTVHLYELLQRYLTTNMPAN